jgi:FdhD protein
VSKAEFPKSVDGSPAAASGTLGLRIQRLGPSGVQLADDRVVVEAPLEIQIHHPTLGGEAVSFGATMRTPGEDEFLAGGLLYGEGIINHASDIEVVEESTRRPNVINVRLSPRVQLDVQAPVRRFSAGSSCGVCGTTGLDTAIARATLLRIEPTGSVELDVLLRLPQLMRASQSKFTDTGGIHASALFDFSGKMLGLAEDVGRHNALDKLIGQNLMAGRLPLTHRIVLLSGRVSFELVQKALRAGVSILAAIGAPSSLSVSLAEATGLTLVGFLREAQCNVYSHPERLIGSDGQSI